MGSLSAASSDNHAVDDESARLRQSLSRVVLPQPAGATIAMTFDEERSRRSRSAWRTTLGRVIVGGASLDAKIGMLVSHRSLGASTCVREVPTSASSVRRVI